MIFERTATHLPAGSLRRVRVGARADVEDHGSTRGNERQAPLDCDRRRRQRAGDGGAVRLERLLLGATANDARVRDVAGEALERGRLSPI